MMIDEQRNLASMNPNVSKDVAKREYQARSLL
jgi:hypothetical protein